METKILDIKNISKSYGGVKALSDVSICIKQGEIHCLVGENGSGKSTLIKICSGIVKQDSGEMLLNGNLYKNIQVIDAIREGIQVIYQDLSLYPNLTIAENIALNQLVEKNIKFVNIKTIKSIAKEALNEIKIDLDLNVLVDKLSMGDKQLIAICRALTHNARLIIMDEPTVALTRNEIEQLFRVIMDLQSKGIATLFVSHKLSEVLQISERVTVLRDGQKVAECETRELDNEKLIFYMTGKKIIKEKFNYNSGKNKNRILLEVRNLTKKNNFKNVNFCLLPGEILGITGLLGSGRTELALSLFGLNEPDSGQIYMNGNLIKIKSPQDAIKAGICYLPEDRLSEGLFINKPVDINLIITNIKKYLNKIKFINYRSIKTTAQKSCINLDIKISSLDSPVKSLSGGNQQKVVIAKWIATNPKIFILDCPTVGVDVASKSNMYKIIKNLAIDNNMGIILISDDIPEVMENCNRILLMRKGQIISEADPNNITEDELFYKMSSAN